jgi:hypothetical protein
MKKETLRDRFEKHIKRNYWSMGGLNDSDWGVMHFDDDEQEYENQFTQDMFVMFCAGFRSRSQRPLT